MTTEKSNENFEKLMAAHHGRMIDFVKFAETKNAALLTFCSAWLAVIVGLLKNSAPLPLGYDLILPIVLVLIAAAGFIALKSFLPRLLDDFHKPEDGTKNLLFFGHIASLTPEKFQEKAKERYLPTDGGAIAQAYLDDLLVQTAVQAQIADKKFKAFKSGVLLVFFAGIIAALPALWKGFSLFVSTGVAHGWF